MMDTSLMTYALYPLTLIPLVKADWAGQVYHARMPHIYEHVFGPVIIMALARLILPPASLAFVWMALVLVHLIAKEVFVDPLVNHKPFNWPNIFERAYGCLLALPFSLGGFHG